MLTSVLQYVLIVVEFLGAIFALFMGRYPKGFRDLSAYALRYTAQTWGYLLLLTDRYPTLSSGLEPPAQSRPGATSQSAPSAAPSDSGTSTTPTDE